jgi:hypothetical protein
MARKADAGRSGALRGSEKRDSTLKGSGKGSRDIGEPAGQMKQKSVTISPQTKHDQVGARGGGRQTRKGVTR